MERHGPGIRPLPRDAPPPTGVTMGRPDRSSAAAEILDAFDLDINRVSLAASLVPEGWFG